MLNPYKVYLAFGTNLGSKVDNLQQAIKEVERKVGKIQSVSSVYETIPFGFNSPNTFLNCVVCLNTSLSPVQLLKEIQTIERNMGRIRNPSDVYEDRIIDIDIIFYDDIVLLTDNLQIPHPKLQQRMFVLQPLVEIEPQMKHPVLKKTVEELLWALLKIQNSALRSFDKILTY